MKEALKILIINDERDVCSLNKALLSVGISAKILESESRSDKALEHQIVLSQQHLQEKQKKLAILQAQIEEQSRELQAIERLKTSLLRTLSNELRSPLNLILGYSQMLLRQHFGKLNSQQQRIIEKVFCGGKSLLRSLDRMLEISQLEAECWPLENQEFNLNYLVREVIKELSPQAEAKNIALQVNCNLQQPIITGDRDRWRQILVNLIGNGINFTEQGEVKVSIVELSGNRLTIQVKDTGIGIASDCLDKIFDKFWQADRSLERQHQSLGLGLTLVKILVEKMQGTIAVDSQVGKGSTFFVELPHPIKPAS